MSTIIHHGQGCVYTQAVLLVVAYTVPLTNGRFYFAGTFDYSLMHLTTRFQLSGARYVTVNLLRDAVSLEGVETFQLRLEPESPGHLLPNEFLRDITNVEIVDITSELMFPELKGHMCSSLIHLPLPLFNLEISVWFMEVDYACNEDDEAVPVKLMQNVYTELASDLVLYVTPLTFDEARKKGVPVPSLPAYLCASRRCYYIIQYV